MVRIQDNVDLLPYNTFHVHAHAKHFAIIQSLDDAKEIIQSSLFKDGKHLILGGGSNILLKGDFDGLVVKNEITGIDILEENDSSVTIRFGAGENWHRCVMYCVDHDYGGIENLSLIPGTIGAAPMQNIGAYGVEIKNVLTLVEALHLSTGEVQTFTNTACEFGYRESIFKHQLKNQYLISSVTLILTKKNHHFNTSYGSIQDMLTHQGINSITIKAISDAVIAIRKSKLPDPAVIGNAGSFFKNPSIDVSLYDTIKQHHPTLPSYPGENGLIKIPAGWLIEQAGWKGKTLDNIGVHKDQALVLVNHGGGTGEKIWNLAMTIQESVREKFGIVLHPEVNMI